MLGKPTAYPHITQMDDGRLMVDGTRLSVEQVVIEHVDRGWDAATIQQNHPSHSLGAIYSVLAYYYDHQEEMDQLIADSVEEEARLRAEIEAMPGNAELRERILALRSRQ